jgi:hypothetical protein
MRRNEPDPMTAEERLHAIAAVLAAGVLRLGTSAQSEAARVPSAPESPLESGPNCLEVPGEPRLSVHDG